MDHIGPITKRVEDAALMLAVMGGFDETDPISSTSPVPNYVDEIHQESKRVIVGVPTNYFFDPCASDIGRTVRTAVHLLESIGCTIVEFEFPLINEIIAAHNIILSAEASACHQHWLMQKGSEFSSDVRSSLEQGLFVSAVDYINALRFRGVAFPRIVSLFKDFDVIVTPTEPFLPPMSGETVVEFGGIREDYEIANMRYLAPFNLLGLPALSLPCGFAENGLPIGMQVIGKPFDETTVLKVGYMYENSTDWHLKYPDKY
jgi:Asp-tRNA(Asn)/Glu-tRNA(Gln) amidotransferase A subunit family amidase